MIFGGLGASGADLAKKLEKCAKKLGVLICIWRSIFDRYRQNVGIEK